MLDAVRKAGVKTVVSFVLRWNPLFATIKAMVADDAVGDLYCVETDYQHDIASWWTGYEDARTKALGISALLTGGCHALDAARWFAAKGRYEAATPSRCSPMPEGGAKAATPNTTTSPIPFKRPRRSNTTTSKSS